MSIQHKGLAEGRWFTLSLAEQMGNIGSEVGRALSWRKKGNAEYSEKAFVRSLELLGFTLADERWRGPKRKEIARVRESWCEFITEKTSTDGSDSGWFRYFDHFAVMARSRKGL